MLFSIIVPAYNAEKYLHRCIDSVLQQTERDFELLLVDDGSRDNTLAICNERAAADSRIKVLHKENGGVSSARNHGLDHASGEYVMFIDADDYLTPDALEQCRNHTPEQDIVRFAYTSILPDGRKMNVTMPNPSSHNDYIGQVVGRTTTVAVWGGIFRRELFKQHNIRFSPDIKVGEDWLVTMQLTINTSKIKVLHEAYCYVYDRSNEASCTNNLTPARCAQQLEVLYMLRQLVPEGHYEHFLSTNYSLTNELAKYFGVFVGSREIYERRDRIIMLSLKEILSHPRFSKKLRLLRLWLAYQFVSRSDKAKK